MIENLLHYDEQLFVFLNNLGNPTWDGFWLFITSKFGSIPLYIILLYFIFKQFGWKTTLIILLLLALMIAATDQFANLFKHGFQRPRPCQEEHLKEIIRFIAPRCGRYGYFSAHAASAMALAVFIGLMFKNSLKYLPYFMLFWAAIVGYSRIYLGVHYPLDVVTGFAIGGIIGYLFYLLLQKWVKPNISNP
ncbi:MAG: phosphatase PAP2 family protein [Bacteroidetes bacterium HGW-Bacteroidetes-2]|jgi:undecaprenyl-diphosphatase|nr:MAG: phosphatase PAP2 family protein [Bacteroidetes bacterium HGW-Bacteroidetes-2]